MIVNECEKAWRNPVLICLLSLFLLFNTFFVLSNSYNREEIKTAGQLADTYGVQITEESLRALDQDLNEELIEANEILQSKGFQGAGSLAEFTERVDFSREDFYSEEEWDFLQTLYLKTNYADVAHSIDQTYQSIDWQEIAELEIGYYSLTDSGAEWVRNEYERFNHRFADLLNREEHQTWFILGTVYQMHSFLFRSIGVLLFFQGLILVVLVTSLITNYEYEHRTYLTVLPTKKGRVILKEKLFASCMASLSFIIPLFAITLVIYFSTFDYSGLWTSSISSAFNAERSLPFVSWWDFSFGEYLFFNGVVTISCLFLFILLTFGLAILLKNTYFTFLAIAIVFALGYIIPSFLSFSSILLLLANFNPSTLALNPHSFFMANNGLTVFQYYELLTIGIWSGISTLFVFAVYRRFKRQDIY